MRTISQRYQIAWGGRVDEDDVGVQGDDTGEVAGALVELIDAAGDAHAILTNVLAHQGGTMTAADRRSRGELAQRLHSILDALHGVQGCGGGR